MSKRTEWRDALSPAERSELRELDRQIKIAADPTTKREKKDLVFLKHQRKIIQNRVTVRARRKRMMTTSRVAAMAAAPPDL